MDEGINARMKSGWLNGWTNRHSWADRRTV